MIAGVGRTVKFTPLLASPLIVTTTFPLVALAGTGTTIDVVVQLVGVAVVPLNVTVPAVPRLVPTIVTTAALGADEGEIPVIFGGGTIV